MTVKVVELEARDDIAATADQVERTLPQMERLLIVRARQYRVFFAALVDEGFEEDQALQLTEAEFMSLD